jgi:hypothetical protein
MSHADRILVELGAVSAMVTLVAVAGLVTAFAMRLST